MARFLVLALFLILAAPAVAAGQKPPPVELPGGEIYCSECGMKVGGDSLKFASQIILKGGKARYFCDIGDFLVHYEVHRNKDQIAAMYIKDFATGAWAEGRDASYLADSKVKTPMRYGILAFRDKESAEKFRKEKGGGRIYTFTEIIGSRIFRR